MRKLFFLLASLLLATQLSGCCDFFWHGCGYRDGGGRGDDRHGGYDNHRDEHHDDHGGYR